MKKKSLFASKTVLLNGLVAVAALFPAVKAWCASHPDLVLYGLAGANFVLRLATKQAVELFPADDEL